MELDLDIDLEFLCNQLSYCMISLKIPSNDDGDGILFVRNFVLLLQLFFPTSAHRKRDRPDFTPYSSATFTFSQKGHDH